MTLRYQYGVQIKTPRCVMQDNQSSLAFHLLVSEELDLVYIG